MAGKRKNLIDIWPGPAWLGALLATCVMVASYIGTAELVGLSYLDGTEGSLIPVDTGFWAAIMTSIIFGLSLFFSAHGPKQDARALARMPVAAETHAALDQEIGAALMAPAAQRTLRRWTIGAVVTGFLFGGVGIGATIPVEDWDLRLRVVVWFACVLPIVFAYFTRSALTSQLYDRAMFDWLRRHVRVDLLDATPLKPFATMALNRALRWSMILTALALILLGTNVSALLMMPLILAWLFVAVQAFLRPMRGIHRRLVEEKQATISRLNAQIEAARHAMEAGNATEAARIQGLIAYRGLILEAKEWPYDVGTLARLSLYLAIPVGGWIGGALVEQIIEAVM